MKKKRRGIVERQPTRDTVGSSNSYSFYCAANGEEENVLANPDSLPEQSAAPSTPQLLMGEAIAHLQGRQKEVYLSIMRDDKSLAETGEMLGIGKSTVQVHLDRAIAFITQYCRQAEERGRV